MGFVLMLVVAAVLNSASADYKCLCSYQVEAEIFDKPDVTSTVSGYMYEFDCKPAYTVSWADAKFQAVGNEKKLGYVELTSQTQVQTCQGSIPETDKVPPEMLTASTTTTFQTTSATLTSNTLTTQSITPTFTLQPKATTTTLKTTTTPPPPPTTSTSITTTQPKSTKVMPTTLTTTHKPTVMPSTTPISTMTPTTPIPTTTMMSTPSATTTPKPTTTVTTPMPTTTIMSTTSATTTPKPTTTVTTPMPTTTIMSTTSATTTPKPTTTVTTPMPTTTIMSTPSATTTPKPTTTVTTPMPTTTIMSTTSATTTSKPTTTVTTTATTTLLPAHGNTIMCSNNLRNHTKPEQLFQHGKYCYEYVPHAAGWLHAEYDCKNKGGVMLFIENQSDQDFVYNMLIHLHVYVPVWLGLHDLTNEERWEWVSDAPLNYTNWMPGRYIDRYHDQEDCALFVYSRRGQWDDVSCSGILFSEPMSHPWICQYNAPLNYTNWMPGRYIDRYHDQEDCALFVYSRRGQWDDVSCSGILFSEPMSHPWICQYNTTSTLTRVG